MPTITEYYGISGPVPFIDCETTTIYLVAYHLCRRPIMCLPEQIAPETELDQ